MNNDDTRRKKTSGKFFVTSTYTVLFASSHNLSFIIHILYARCDGLFTSKFLLIIFINLHAATLVFMFCLSIIILIRFFRPRSCLKILTFKYSIVILVKKKLNKFRVTLIKIRIIRKECTFYMYHNLPGSMIY